MTFPVDFHVLGHPIPAHFIFESLGYFVGFRVYRHLRANGRDPLTDGMRWSIVAAAAIGGALGSKLLVWLQHAPTLLTTAPTLERWMAGKTIVGGLLGGTAAVEWMKWRAQESRRTGDLFVMPLCVGIAIGRIGCFLAGLTDATHGGPTSLPWGVDLGDGILRHPVQLYEIMALASIATWARVWQRSSRFREGELYRGFLFGYLAFRLAADALKPDDHVYVGLSAIQWACIAGMACYAPDVWRMARARE